MELCKDTPFVLIVYLIRINLIFMTISDVNVNADDCFWISQDYYEDACNFINREFTSDDNEN